MNHYEILIEKLEQSLPNVSPEDMLRWQHAPQPCLLVDVREPDEFGAGHIPGSINLPRRKLEAEIESKMTIDTQRIVIYCGGRGRSHLVAHLLREMDLNAYVLANGYGGWQFSVEK